MLATLATLDVPPMPMPTSFAARFVALVLLAWAVTVTGASADPGTPVLRYAAPPDAYRAASSGLVEDYSLGGTNASVQVYQFRPFAGDIRQAFQTTLLRDWIMPTHQEENVATQPTFQAFNVPGAQYALIANFGENVAGNLRPHFRMLIVAGGQAAIFDASASGQQSWQQAAAPINGMIGTLRVEAARGPAPLREADGRLVAGLYRGIKTKYTATSINITGSPTYVSAQHFYMFSVDGRVYCAFDALPVPQGRPELFDFDAAERRDAANSGRYTVDGGKLIIQMTGEQPTATDLPRNGRVRIDSVIYERQ